MQREHVPPQKMCHSKGVSEWFLNGTSSQKKGYLVPFKVYTIDQRRKKEKEKKRFPLRDSEDTWHNM